MVQACQVLTGLCDTGRPRPPTQTWQLLPRLSGRGRPLSGSSVAVAAAFGWERAPAAAAGHPKVPICELMALLTPLFFMKYCFLMKVRCLFNEHALFILMALLCFLSDNV